MPPPETVSPTWPESETIVPSCGAIELGVRDCLFVALDGQAIALDRRPRRREVRFARRVLSVVSVLEPLRRARARGVAARPSSCPRRSPSLRSCLSVLDARRASPLCSPAGAFVAAGVVAEGVGARRRRRRRRRGGRCRGARRRWMGSSSPPAATSSTTNEAIERLRPSSDAGARRALTGAFAVGFFLAGEVRFGGLQRSPWPVRA